MRITAYGERLQPCWESCLWRALGAERLRREEERCGLEAYQ